MSTVNLTTDTTNTNMPVNNTGSNGLNPPRQRSSDTRKLRIIPQSIQHVISIGVGAKYDDVLGGWFIPGFYKAKGVVIKYDDPKDPESGKVYPMIKKTNGQAILNFDDLIELNYAWWCHSRKDSLEYEMPEDAWRDEFHALGMVERKMQFLPKSQTFNPLRESI